MWQKHALWNPKHFTKQKCSTLYIYLYLRMKDNQVMYKEEKKSRLNKVLWTLAILAIIGVTVLYVWGKMIHDSITV